MNQIREALVEELTTAGAVAVGFSKAGNVSEENLRQYENWISGGNHAGMDYLPRHATLKRDTHSVLQDASTVVSIAFSYYPREQRDASLPRISVYAYGDDYHEVLRKRLDKVVERMSAVYGGSWRICIDSAPIAERYWAVRSGIGRRALNGSIIVDGFGSFIFLAEILTSHDLTQHTGNPDSFVSSPPDRPAASEQSLISSYDISCLQCGECVRACPTEALLGDGTLDARRCINYLTIEHRGEWTEEGKKAMQTEAGRHTLFGCDICQSVCPHNRDITPCGIKEFLPHKEIVSGDDTCLGSRDRLLAIDQAEFSRLFKGSPVKRTKLAGFLRNAANLK